MSSAISLVEVKVKQICVAWLWHPIRGNKAKFISCVCKYTSRVLHIRTSICKKKWCSWYLRYMSHKVHTITLMLNSKNKFGTTSMAAAYINQLYLGYNYEKS